MSGAFTQDYTPTDDAVKDTNSGSAGTGTEQEQGYPTDVEGVNADDVVKQGTEEYPVFDIPKKYFYSNMEGNRKRMRFPSGSNAQKYVQKTRNSLRPFYVRTYDDNGKSFVRKIR